MPISVVTLHAACMLTSMCCPRPVTSRCQHRGERAHHRPRAADVERLVAAAAHRRERVVVVAAAPHRAAAGEQGEIGGGLVRARALTPERRDRDPDQPLVSRRAARRWSSPSAAERARRLALEHDVGVGHETADTARRPSGVVEVEHDAALRRVVVPPPEAALGIGDVVDEGPVRRGWRDRRAARRRSRRRRGRRASCPRSAACSRRQLDDLQPRRARPWACRRAHITPSCARAARSRRRRGRAPRENTWSVVLAEARPAALDRPVGLREVQRDAVDADVAHLAVVRGRPQAPLAGAGVVVDAVLRAARPRAAGTPAARSDSATANWSRVRVHVADAGVERVLVRERARRACRCAGRCAHGSPITSASALQSSSSRHAIATQSSSPSRRVDAVRRHRAARGCGWSRARRRGAADGR